MLNFPMKLIEYGENMWTCDLYFSCTAIPDTSCYYDSNLAESDCVENRVVCKHLVIYRFADRRKTCDSFECKIVLRVFEYELFDSVDGMHASYRRLWINSFWSMMRAVCVSLSQFVGFSVGFFSYWISRNVIKPTIGGIYSFENRWNRFYYAHWKIERRRSWN